MNTKILTFLSALVAFLGFLDATYLTIEHFQNKLPPCSLAHGCETVLTSTYSMIGPIPLAIVGIAFYALMLLLCLLVIVNKKELMLKFFLPLTTLALLQSVIYFAIQALVIHAFCQYCLSSEAINILLFVLSFLIYKVLKTHRMTDVKR